MNDILISGGFTPEIPDQVEFLDEQELKNQQLAEEEIRQMKILAKSPAWQKVKAEFLAEIENLKFEVCKGCDNNGSLEKIGENFKIYRICEQKLKSLIEKVDSVEGGDNG